MRNNNNYYEATTRLHTTHTRRKTTHSGEIGFPRLWRPIFFQVAWILSNDSELILSACLQPLLYSKNGSDWYDINSSWTSCKKVLSCRDDLGTYIAVGEGPTPILYSYDTIYWNDASCNGLFTKVNSVAYGNGIYVAVGAGSNTRIAGGSGSYKLAYSVDGKSWTGIETSVFDDSVQGLAFDRTYHLMIACGTGSTNTLAYSNILLGASFVQWLVFTKFGVRIKNERNGIDNKSAWSLE